MYSHLACSFHCCSKAFKFNQVPLVYFCFDFHDSRRWVIEDLALVYVIECSALFSSKSFILSGLILGSLIHFEYVFVCGVRNCSNFILLPVAVQFSQHHLLKRLFLPLYILASFVENKVLIGAWVYFWVFSLVPLVYISVIVPVHTVLMTVALQYNLKSGRLIPPAPFFFLKTALAIQSLLCFHINCDFFFFLVLVL